jgi:hypothetical protein
MRLNNFGGRMFGNTGFGIADTMHKPDEYLFYSRPIERVPIVLLRRSSAEPKGKGSGRHTRGQIRICRRKTHDLSISLWTVPGPLTAAILFYVLLVRRERDMHAPCEDGFSVVDVAAIPGPS